MGYEIEVQYLRFILGGMRSREEGNRLLVNTERVYLAKTNLLLVKALLEEFGGRGVFVAIDRPYHYMDHLLRIHKIPHEELLFIDAVTNISGERRVEGEGVSFLDTPFTIQKILRDLRIQRKRDDGGTEEVDLLDRDFLVIDDVSAMFYYGGVTSRQQILREFLEAVSRRPETFAAVVVDREVHRELYEFLSDYVDHGVDMGTASFQMADDSDVEEVPETPDSTAQFRVRG